MEKRYRFDGARLVVTSARLNQCLGRKACGHTAQPGPILFVLVCVRVRSYQRSGPQQIVHYHQSHKTVYHQVLYSKLQIVFCVVTIMLALLI